MLPGNDPVVLITPTPVAQVTMPPVFVEKTSAPQTTIPQEEAQWTSPLPGYTAYCTAVVNNSNGQRLNLRSLPSTQSESLGLYYTGLKSSAIVILRRNGPMFPLETGTDT